LHHDDPTGVPLPDFFARALALPLDPAIDDIERVSFRHFLYGRRALPGWRIGGGALVLLMAHLLAVGGARMFAAQQHATRVDVTHFNRAHMLVHRILRRKPALALAAATEHLAPVAAAAPTLFTPRA
jgi:hypothetical protein